MMRTRVAEAAMGAPKRGFELLPALRAMPINSFKRGTDWALRSFIYFHLKKDMDPMTSGFISGIIAGTITTPIDRLLPVLQQNNPPKSITTWFRNSIQEKGFAQFLREQALEFYMLGGTLVLCLGTSSF